MFVYEGIRWQHRGIVYPIIGLVIGGCIALVITLLFMIKPVYASPSKIADSIKRDHHIDIEEKSEMINRYIDKVHEQEIKRKQEIANAKNKSRGRNKPK